MSSRTNVTVQFTVHAWHRCRVLLAIALVALLGPPPANAAASEQIAGPSANGESGGGPRLGSPELPSELESVSRVPGRYIVVLKDSVDHPRDVAEHQVARRRGRLGLLYRHALTGYSAALTKEAVEALRRDPRVKYVAPDRYVEAYAQSVPAGIERIFAVGNTGLDIDGEDDVRIDADVAVIDTGVDYTHPDLDVVRRANCVPANESEYSAETCVDNAGTDSTGHGTHVAGTIAALDNDFGVVGTAPGARLWSLKALGQNGTGYTSWIIAAIDWVTARSDQIEIVNMSLGGGGSSPPQEQAIAASVNQGVVYVVAAGNNSRNALNHYPANGPDVITVSGLADYDGEPGGASSPTCINRGEDDTSYSNGNWGDAIEIAAPGVCIYSTLPAEKYGMKTGTSMATPHVTGAAASLASQSNPNSRSDVEGIRKALIDAGSLDWEDTSQDGRVEPLLYLGNTTLTNSEVATAGWSSDDGETARLKGSLNPRGLDTSYQFELGTTTSYGTTAPASAKVVSGAAGYSAVEESVSGLKPETLYHYRIKATNASGTFYGEDRIFTVSRWQFTDASTVPTKTGNEWLEDVSCPTTSFCMGVGYHYNSDNYVGSYRYDGSGWHFQSMPLPPGGSFPEIHGVSCSAANSCVAVGEVRMPGPIVEPLIEKWNGTAWSIEGLTPPTSGASEPRALLQDVHCISSISCMAVGHYRDSNDEWVNYSARLYGNSWENVAVPTTESSEQSDLEDVSCFTASSCTAVGWYNPKPSGAAKRVILKWNGSSWSYDSPANPAGRGLRSVSCVGESFCAAVGFGPTVEHWTGSEWKEITLPSEIQSTGDLEGVSCTSASHCTAVGASKIGARTSGLVVVWDGSTWETEAVPQIDDHRDDLKSVSCLPLWGCASVGFKYGAFLDRRFAMRRDVVAHPASDVQPGEATINGMINAGGLATTYQFQYGKTTSYGTTVPASPQSVGTPGKATIVSYNLPELTAETTYHYRLVATNASETRYSEDQSFRTGAPPYQYVTAIGSAGSGNGQLNGPRGLAVDGEGNLWVADSKNHRVQKFDPNGTYLGQFGSFGSGAGQFNEPEDLAFTQGGDLWVTDKENDRAQKFSVGGEYLTEFGSSGTSAGKFTYPKGIAVATNGQLWVADHLYRRAQQFTSAGGFIQAVGDTAHGGGGQTEFLYPDGVAIDDSGNVWVADRHHDQVQKLSASGQYLGSFGETGPGKGQLDRPTAIDIKPSGDLLVEDRSTGRVRQFTDAGQQVTEFNGSGEHQGIAATEDGAVYVSRSNGSTIEKWQQQIPVSSTQDASEITSTSALLSGMINPRGKATTYHFEFGATTTYGSKAPSSGGSAGEGTANVNVSEPIKGLEPSTTYHYRLVGSSINGTIYGEDKTFKTTRRLPTASTGSPSGISATSATLNGKVNPEGEATAYHFEYGTTTAYGSKQPLSPKDIGSGQEALAVSETLSGLAEGTEYHYRVVASSPEGTTQGADKTFKTKSIAGSLSAMPVTEPFIGGGESFSANWTTLGWAAGKGEDWFSGWRPTVDYPTVQGAFANAPVSDMGEGVATVATMAVNLASTHRFSLWLNLANPGSTTKTGYELRVVQSSLLPSGEYMVLLTKWQGGTDTGGNSQTLAIPAGSSLALVDTGGTVSAWLDTGSGFTQLLSIEDSAFSSGNAGLQGSGKSIRLSTFKAGPLG